jgi:hypothetical protein
MVSQKSHGERTSVRNNAARPFLAPDSESLERAAPICHRVDVQPTKIAGVTVVLRPPRFLKKYGLFTNWGASFR